MSKIKTSLESANTPPTYQAPPRLNFSSNLPIRRFVPTEHSRSSLLGETEQSSSSNIQYFRVTWRGGVVWKLLCITICFWEWGPIVFINYQSKKWCVYRRSYYDCDSVLLCKWSQKDLLYLNCKYSSFSIELDFQVALILKPYFFKK